MGSGLKALIQKMSLANPLWGAPRIHGELLKLGFDISQRSVARPMPRRRKPPSRNSSPRPEWAVGVGVAR